MILGSSLTTTIGLGSSLGSDGEISLGLSVGSAALGIGAALTGADEDDTERVLRSTILGWAVLPLNQSVAERDGSSDAAGGKMLRSSAR